MIKFPPNGDAVWRDVFSSFQEGFLNSSITSIQNRKCLLFFNQLYSREHTGDTFPDSSVIGFGRKDEEVFCCCIDAYRNNFMWGAGSYLLGDVGPEGVYVHHILEGTNLTPRDPGVIAEHVYFDAEKTEEASLPIEVDRDLSLYIEWCVAE